MEMNTEFITSSTHEVKIVDRKEISFSGVKKIVSFDAEEFLLETIMGMVLLKGNGLELLRLDTHDGNVRIKGKINSYQYLENGKVKNKEESFLSKLFK
ncbi:MAG: sporulation protein YabP [Bacilli bacterium]|nr:sporulation protein YabP [Bacilli bacterium]